MQMPKNHFSPLRSLRLFLFQPETIVSGFGGALSLYLGVAIILLFELIELTCFVAVRVWKHVNGGKSSSRVGSAVKPLSSPAIPPAEKLYPE